MKLIQRLGLGAIALSVLLAFNAAAGVPNTLSYQATLKDSAGAYVTGSKSITYSLYDNETGGAPFWTETLPTTVIDGRLSVTLGGATNPLNPNQFTGETYIGVRVAPDTEMPRQKLTSVAYALQAGDGGIPRGGIIMWSGSTPPPGWALCDGQNGTPDLQNRFIVGAGLNYTTGATGGEATHTLTLNEIPAHAHAQQPHTHGVADPGHAHSLTVDTSDGTAFPYGQTGNDNRGTVSTNTAWTGISIGQATATNQASGGGAAHENRPPYYALAFIMKL